MSSLQEEEWAAKMVAVSGQKEESKTETIEISPTVLHNASSLKDLM